MGNRKSIGNKILNYVYILIIILFIVIVFGFNIAVRAFAVDRLKSQLEVTKEAVERFDKSLSLPKGSGRRSMMERMLRLDLTSSDVSILFLNENKELSMDIVKSDSIMNMSQGSMGNMGGMMGQGKHGSSKGQNSSQTNPTKDTTSGSLEDYSMVLGKTEYDESIKVLNYIKSSNVPLKNYDYTRENINGESYYLKSIPFSDEYILSFVPVKVYDGFISNTLRILFLILGVVLVATWFIVKILANQIAKPIKQLENLSRKIGSGDFTGETYNFKEEELFDLNESLNESAQKLKEFQDNRNVFFQNVSHELRTPLTSIRGYAEGITYGVFESKEAGEIIIKESQKLEKLVEDILYLSRMESYKDKPEEKTNVKLSEILMEVKSSFSNEAILNNKEIDVNILNDVSINVIEDELLRAVSNLISNGLRYANKKITLTGKIVKDSLVITIEDDGPGIEPEILDKMFERFTKGKSGKHGIGLSIAKAAVEKYQGSISAINLKTGALFTITIPLSKVLS